MTQPNAIPYHSVDPQSLADMGNIRTLSICHYVWGLLTMAFSSIFVVHIVLGVAMLSGKIAPPPGAGAPPPNWFAAIFIAMGSSAVAIGWSVGLLTILSGRYMMSRRRRMFSLVMAGVNCAFFPFGTLLGVFTFVVLLRPSVRLMYEESRV